MVALAAAWSAMALAIQQLVKLIRLYSSREPEWNINDVTQDIFDPISREPNYKQCAVRVERVSAS